MNNELVSSMLMQTAERMMDLASRIGRGGKSLTKSELTLARAAVLPAVIEVAESIVIDFMSGTTCHERVANQLAELEVL